MSKQYYDDDGGLIFVSQGISKSHWMTVRQKKPTSGTHRVVSPALPLREDRYQAQEDLDAYALKRKWDEAY